MDLYCEGGMPADSIKRAVEGESGVVSAHTVAGEASALLHVMAEDTQDLELCLERLRVRVDSMKMGDPLDEATDIGTIVSPQQYEK